MYNKQNQQILITILGVTIHRLSKDKRKKIEQGKCSIYSKDNEYFIRVNNFVLNLKNISFGEIKYPKSVAYYFYQQSHQESINVISAAFDVNSDQLVNEFQNKISTYSFVKQLSTTSSDSQLLKRVQNAYPSFETKQVQSHDNKLSKISKQVGGFVGAISNLVSKPAQKVGHVVDQKKQELYQTRIKKQTKNKWQTVKNKAEILNQSISKTFKPVSQGAKQISRKMGHSFNHSNNSFIKAIRNFGNKTKNALNQGYSEGMGIKDKPQPLKAQSDFNVDTNFDTKK